MLSIHGHLQAPKGAAREQPAPYGVKAVSEPTPSACRNPPTLRALAALLELPRGQARGSLRTDRRLVGFQPLDDLVAAGDRLAVDHQHGNGAGPGQLLD